MTLTFEISKEGDELEVIFNEEGYHALMKALEELKPFDEKIKHTHLMTKEWGGEGLSSNVMHEGNDLINHVKLIFLNED